MSGPGCHNGAIRCGWRLVTIIEVNQLTAYEISAFKILQALQCIPIGVTKDWPDLLLSISSATLTLPCEVDISIGNCI